MAVIKTCGLTKYYGKNRGICDVNLSVEKGDFFGFIGPNGAGKSTTIRVLLGLIQKSGGTAEVFGKDICKNQTEILANIGYLPSEISFYNGMKAGEIIKLSAKLRNKDCTAQAKIICDRLDLDISKKVSELSLGNRKKVGIVCALQHNPDLLILDEPTSGLDPLIQNEFHRLLKERTMGGATVFLSSHILSEVQKYCNRAAIIKDGSIVACDSVENLKQTSAKRVHLVGVEKIPNIDGIKDEKLKDGNASFLWNGDINLLLEEISALKPDDVTITEPELSEIFLHYYNKDGEE